MDRSVLKRFYRLLPTRERVFEVAGCTCAPDGSCEGPMNVHPANHQPCCAAFQLWWQHSAAASCATDDKWWQEDEFWLHDEQVIRLKGGTQSTKWKPKT